MIFQGVKFTANANDDIKCDECIKNEIINQVYGVIKESTIKRNWTYLVVKNLGK